MAKTITICFTNNKGGSGKSTTCSNLGAAMSRAGKKVLLVDGDMQLNLSLAVFPEDWVLEHAQGEKNLYHAIGKQEDLTDYIVHTPYESLDLIPSSTLMSSIEYELFTKWQREFILKKCIQKIKDSGVYDYILIDAPPTLGGWVMNILCASDKVIIPVDEARELQGDELRTNNLTKSRTEQRTCRDKCGHGAAHIFRNTVRQRCDDRCDHHVQTNHGNAVADANAHTVRQNADEEQRNARNNAARCDPWRTTSEDRARTVRHVANHEVGNQRSQCRGRIQHAENGVFAVGRDISQTLRQQHCSNDL